MYVQQGKGLRRHVKTHPHVPPTSLAERSIVQLNLPCCSNYSTFLRKTSTFITMCQSTTCSTCRKFRASRPRTTTAFCQLQKIPIRNITHQPTLYMYWQDVSDQNIAQRAKPGWVAARTSHRSSTLSPRASGARADRRSRRVARCILLEVCSCLKSS